MDKNDHIGHMCEDPLIPRPRYLERMKPFAGTPLIKLEAEAKAVPDSGKVALFIDEAQEILGFDRALRSLTAASPLLRRVPRLP